MSTVTPVQGAASLLLQQAILVPASHSSAAVTDVETATAVQPVDPISKHDPVTAQARSRVSEALFDAESSNFSAIKIRLIESVAGALGINQENYGSDSAFRAAIRAAFDELATNPHAREIIAGLPRDLGLDGFGASLKQAAEAAKAAAEAQRDTFRAERAAEAEQEADTEAADAKAAETAKPAPAPKTAEAAAPPKAEPQAALPASAAVPKAGSATPAPAAAPEPASAPAPIASSAPAAAA